MVESISALQKVIGTDIPAAAGMGDHVGTIKQLVEQTATSQAAPLFANRALTYLRIALGG